MSLVTSPQVRRSARRGPAGLELADENPDCRLELLVVAFEGRMGRIFHHDIGLDPLPSARDFVIGLTERETVYRDVLERQRQHEATAKQLAEREVSARSAQEALLARRESYGRLAGVAAHLALGGQAPPQSRADLNAALRANDDTRQILRSRIAELTTERQTALA